MAGPWDATRGFQPAHERADVPWFASEEFERDARESEPVASEDVEPKPPREPPAAPPPMPRAGFPAEGTFSARLRARLRTPNSLREAFVVKEILDRPVALRRGRTR